MARASPIQSNFNAGKLSKRLEGRVDIAKYGSGCRQIQNFIPQVQGPAQKRSGTQFVIQASQTPTPFRQDYQLVPFEFSTDDAYVLLFSPETVDEAGAIWFFRNSGVVIAPTTNFTDSDVKIERNRILLLDSNNQEIAHFYVNKQGPFRLTTTGVLPGGLALLTDYFIYKKTIAAITFIDGDVTPAADTITETAHGFVVDDGPFQFTTTGTLPAGLALATDYWIESVPTANTFTVSLTQGGAVVDITAAAGGGTHTFTHQFIDGIGAFGLSLTKGGPLEDITSAGGGGTHTVTPVGTVPHELVHPYRDGEVKDLAWTQSGDVLFLTERNHAPAKILRFANTEWTIEDIDFNFAPFQPENLDDTSRVLSSATTGVVTLISTKGLFKTGHIGSFIKLRVSVDGQYAIYEQDVNFFAEWALDNFAVGSPFQNEGNVYRISDTAGFTVAGKTPPVHRVGVETDGRAYYEFLHSGAGYARIDSITDGFKAAGTVIRFIPRGAVSTISAIASIPNVNPARITTTGVHGLETGDLVFIEGIVGMVEINNREFTVTRISTTVFDINVDATGFATYVSGGNAYLTKSTNQDAVAIRRIVRGENFAFGAWSDVNGFPRAVTFFEERLWYGGSTLDPQTLWASRTGDFQNHETTDDDEGALIFTLATDKVNVIEWISPGKVLVIGTAGGEFIASASTLEVALTPGNLRIVRHSNFGSRESAQPLRIEQVVLFVQRHGRKLREFVFDFDTDSFVAPDLTVLADDLFVAETWKGIDEMGQMDELVFQQEPNRLMWALLNTGQLLSMTYDRNQQVVGWHTHQLGGRSAISQDLKAKVESIAVIPHPDGDGDQLWMVVQRTSNGLDNVYHVEFMSKDWVDTNDLNDVPFVDSSIAYNPLVPAIAETLTGLDHLEGEEVMVLGDRRTQGPFKVSSGAITLTTGVNRAQVGMAYEAILQTMRFEGGSQEGTAQGKFKRITKVVIRLFQVGKGLLYGAEDDTELEEIALAEGVLTDGDTDAVAWPKGYEQAGRVLLKHSTPLPCTITAIMPQISIQDR